MGLDISHILSEWPYEPGQVTARRIIGSDGAEKIQLRLDLGLLQMNAAGRPDGQRPHGFESLMDYYEHQLALYRRGHDSDEGFAVDEEGCQQLQSEGMMYYHRYLAEFILEDYDAVQRDTLRNLRLMDFCRRYAQKESDRMMLEQYRPYVMMMHARSAARKDLRENRPKSALAAVRKGIQDIEDFLRSIGQESGLAASGELTVLRVMGLEIEALIPLDPREKLQKELARAVLEERYEDAASIRDKLERLKSPSP